MNIGDCIPCHVKERRRIRTRTRTRTGLKVGSPSITVAVTLRMSVVTGSEHGLTDHVSASLLAAVTQHQTPGGSYATSIYFSQVWRLGGKDQGAHGIAFKPSSGFADSHLLTRLCPQLVERAGELSGVFFTRALPLFMRLHLWPNLLPSNTITVGTEVSDSKPPGPGGAFRLQIRPHLKL